MQTYVCLSGFPSAVVEEIGRRSAAVFTTSKDNPPIAKAVREPFGFRAGMSDYYLDEIAKRISRLALLEEVSVLMVHADYGDIDTQRFVKAFFPFALCVPIAPFYPDSAPKHERRKALVDFVDQLEKVVATARSKARVVRDALSGQPLSPLLLPLRNFRSEIVTPQIAALFEDLSKSEDPRARLKAAAEAINQRHPLQRLQDKDRTAFYRDDRELRFKSPGKNRHGMTRVVGEGHKPFCLINARVRLGGPFDTLLHYDCDYDRGNVDRVYPNCHGADHEPAQATHANIAPSDAVR